MPKKKKGGGDKEKARKKLLSERETVSYEQQILDNNRQLSRLRSRNDELECEVKNVTKKFEQLKEDQSDVVAHLKRNLEGKIEEAQELSERLMALEELRKQEQAEYKSRENAKELEYRTMESTLSAEVKLSAGKLNALEDWRLARLDLMHKFEVQEKQIAQQEKLHKNTLYETERSVIIAKAKMRKEMEERLKQLAQDFKEATNIRMADVTHNAIRRNIALNHELNSMMRVCQDLEMRNAECREDDRMLRLQCELFEAEAKIALDRMIKHRHAMNQFAQGHIDLVLKHGKSQRTNAKLGNYEQLINEYKARCVESDEKAKILEERLVETKEAKEKILAEVRDKCEKYRKLNEILNRAKRCVLEALEIQEHICTSDVCTSCCADQKQEIIHSLQSILEEHNFFDLVRDELQIGDIEF